jgi:preprotein translocase subunit YajC
MIAFVLSMDFLGLLPHSGLLAMASPGAGGPSAWMQLLPFALVLGIFYFVILMPMRKRQQKVQEFLAALKVGDNVVTSGGIYGSITKLGDDAVQLQIAERVRIDVSRNAIIGYQGQEPVTSEKA